MYYLAFETECDTIQSHETAPLREKWERKRTGGVGLPRRLTRKHRAPERWRNTDEAYVPRDPFHIKQVCTFVLPENYPKQKS